jgi:hypothetical protein
MPEVENEIRKALRQTCEAMMELLGQDHIRRGPRHIRERLTTVLLDCIDAENFIIAVDGE